MLTRYTKSAIRAYAAALAGEGVEELAKHLDRLTSIFYGYAAKQLQIFLQSLKLIENSHTLTEQKRGNAPPITIADLLPSLYRLEVFLGKSSTTARAKDLKALRTALRNFESYTLDELLNAVRVLRTGKPKGGTMDNHTSMAKKLKAALGRDSEFYPLFGELEQLDARGVALVTEALMRGGSAKSRNVDLTRIRERHEALAMDYARKRATAGRSAA